MGAVGALMEPRMDKNQHEYKKAKNSESAESFVSIRVNSWFYSLDHQCPCQVIEAQTLWGETTCLIWRRGQFRTE